MNKETTITPDGRDELYCDWFKCDSCEDTMITESSNYCPNCGRHIKK